MKNKEIIKQDGFGNGIIKEEKVIFVEKGLEGDIVDLKIVNDKKKFSNAIIEKMVKASEQRCEPNCEYYEKCGGCNLLHQKYEHQLKFKDQLVKETFERNGYSDVKINTIQSANQFNYRNKITLHVENNEIGLYQSKSNDLVKINKCVLVDDKINNIIAKLSKIDLEHIFQIVVKTLNEDVIVLLKIDKKVNLNNVVQALKEENVSIFGSYKDKIKQLSGKTTLYNTINEMKYKISPSSFFQVNNNITAKLYNQIKEYASGGNNLLDLYCGVGTIGLYLASSYTNVIGIESVRSSYLDSIENKKLNNVSNIKFINNKCENYINEDVNFDTIVVDPPRNGLEDKTIQFILKNNPKKIIYVSCNLNTLMKNLKELSSVYNLLEVSSFDMFPNTNHVESVCVLSRK